MGRAISVLTASYYRMLDRFVGVASNAIVFPA
jgi:hypothetical protein